MIDKNIANISLEDIQFLIDNSIVENKRLEYKKELHLENDTEKKEFLADISSFANASGGKLIFGITENRKTGAPEKVSGIKIDNPDQTIQKLENIIKSSIEPRIPSIEIGTILKTDDLYLIIIDIPKSFLSPHRVIYKNHGHFYSRTTNGKYPLDVSELRTAFNFSESIIERVRNFRIQRISKVNAGEMPIEFIDGSKCLLHLIPVISFDPSYTIEINKVVENPELIRPIYTMGYSYRYNFDGYLSYAPGIGDKAYTYSQIYKNGIIEAVHGKLLDHDLIRSLTFETEILKAFKTYYSSLKELKVPLPLIVSLTLIGVKGKSLEVYNQSPFTEEINKIDRDILVIPEQIAETYDSSADKILKPIFDTIWNTCGYAFSRYYDKDGHWRGR